MTASNSSSCWPLSEQRVGYLCTQYRVVSVTLVAGFVFALPSCCVLCSTPAAYMHGVHAAFFPRLSCFCLLNAARCCAAVSEPSSELCCAVGEAAPAVAVGIEPPFNSGTGRSQHLPCQMVRLFVFPGPGIQVRLVGDFWCAHERVYVSRAWPVPCSPGCHLAPGGRLGCRTPSALMVCCYESNG